MATVGAFTVGTARLGAHGPIDYGSDGIAKSCSEIYFAIHPRGTQATLLNTSGLPAAYAVHGTFAHLKARAFHFTCMSQDCGTWEIAVDYLDGTLSEAIEGSTSRITAADWGTNECSGDIAYDAEDGTPVLNAAGDAFDSVPQRQFFAPRVHFTRLTSANPASLLALAGTINSSSVTCLGVTFPARTAMLRISGRDLLTDALLRYEVDITLDGRNYYTWDSGGTLVNGGWDEFLVQQGYYYLHTDGSRLRFMEAEEGKPGNKTRPSATPCLLSANGTDGRALAAPIVRQVRAYKAASWSGLNLPA